MWDERIEKLTERRKEVLRLFYQRLDRKEIARSLLISPETVKQHLDAARETLGVSRSAEAARILIEYEDRTSPPSGVNPPRGIGPSGISAMNSPAGQSSGQEDRVTLNEVAASMRQPAGVMRSIPWPFPRKGRPDNDMSLFAILIWIVLTAIGFAAGLLVALALVESLQDLLTRAHPLLHRLF